jgi:hypothetical protein
MAGGLALNLLMWLDQLLIGVYAPASAVGLMLRVHICDAAQQC